MVPLQVATEGIIHELLDTWDVQETDRLLRQISVHREHRNEQYNKGAQALLDRYDSRSISPLVIKVKGKDWRYAEAIPDCSKEGEFIHVEYINKWQKPDTFKFIEMEDIHMPSSSPF